MPRPRCCGARPCCCAPLSALQPPAGARATLRRRPPAPRSNNLLYPKEDRALMALKYVCRRCDYEEDAESMVVYRNELKATLKCAAPRRISPPPPAGDRSLAAAPQPLLPAPPPVCVHPFQSCGVGLRRLAVPCRTQLEKINDEVINDPTLQRDASVVCPKCGPEGSTFGAVFFQATSAATSDERMAVIFVCCNPDCIHKWESLPASKQDALAVPAPTSALAPPRPALPAAAPRPVP